MKKNYRSWRKLFRKDYDFDFAFMLYIEKRKLQNMMKYFIKSNYTENNDIIVRDLKLCIYLLNIILNDDYTHYINLKNGSRFFNKFKLEFINTYPEYKYTLGCAKAWHLYHLIRYYRMKTWWD